MGSSQGPPVEVDWAPVSPIPHVIPWLAVLGLLAVKRNRTTTAWWVLVPLVWAVVLQHLLRSSGVPLPAQVRELLAGVGYSLSFGLAAAWLLATGGSWSRRLAVFLGLVTAGSAFCFALTRESGDVQQEALTGAIAIALVMAIVVLTAALGLAAFACRKSYAFKRLVASAIVLVPVLACLVILPFFV